MAGWMEAYAHSVDVDSLAEPEGVDLHLGSDAQAQGALALLAAQVALHAPAGVVGVGVSDNRALDRLPRVDVEVSVRTEEAAVV